MIFARMRFYRLNREQTGSGSGLGLAIVQTLAAAIGARIELQSARSGQGTLIGIGLPGGE